MLQQRYVVGTMAFLVLALIYSLRMCFPLILTQMVYIPNVDMDGTTIESNGELICPIDANEFLLPQNVSVTSVGDINDRYDWSQELQGIVLSSFYVGNIISQIPGGILTQKYGGKAVLITSTLLSAILMALTPFAVAIGGASGLIITRALTGFIQGPLITCIFYLFIQWFPVEERGRTSSIAFMGANTGAFVSLYITGLVIKYIGRWDVIFYGLAALAVIIGVLFKFLCFNTPEDHPFISEKEKEFLKAKTAQYVLADRSDLPPTPWKKMLTNVPVLTLLLAVFLHNYATYIVNHGLAKYMNDVLHVSIEKNSTVNSLTRIITLFMLVVSGFLSDWMHIKYKTSLTTIRKSFNCLASIIPAIAYIAASYSGCNDMLVIIWLTIAVSGQGFEVAAITVNPLDLSPNYVGPLNSIVISVSSVGSLLAPYTIGILTPNAYLSEWRVVFWIAFAQYFGCAFFYAIWGSAKVQPFNSPQVV